MEKAIIIVIIFVILLFLFFIFYFVQKEVPLITIVAQKDQISNKNFHNYIKKYQYNVINYNQLPKNFQATYYVTLNKIPKIALDNLFKFSNGITTLICKNTKKILAYATWGKYINILWKDYSEYFNNDEIIKSLNKISFYPHLSPNFIIISSKILYPKNNINTKHLIKQYYPCRISTFWGKALIPRNFLQLNNAIVVNSETKNRIKHAHNVYKTYDHYFYSNYTCQTFLQQYYSKNVLETWYQIIDKKIRRFFFIVCWLYLKGGIYSSYKLLHRQSLEKYLTLNNLLLTYNQKGKLSFDIIATKAKNEMFKKIIQEMIYNQQINVKYSIDEIITNNLVKDDRICKIIKKNLFLTDKKVIEFTVDEIVYAQK